MVKQGAPLVISKTFVNTFEEALKGPIIIERIPLDNGEYKIVEKRDPNSYNAIFLTEKDLVIKTNNMLIEAGFENNQVSYRTFQRYKARIVAGISKSGSVDEGIDLELEGESLENMKQLGRVIEKHLTEQKERLFASMLSSPSNMWQKYAWILERKFDSWNIRQKVEDVNETKRLNLAQLNAQAKALGEASTIPPLENSNGS